MKPEPKETHLLALLYRVEDLIFDMKLDGYEKLEEEFEKLSKAISDLQNKLKTKD
jgi:hypothetical protein